MDKFKLVSPYKPQGDQPQAIGELTDGLKRGDQFQTLLGVRAVEKPLPWPMLLKMPIGPL